MKHLLSLVVSLIFLMGAALGQEQPGLQPHGEVLTGHGPAAGQPAPVLPPPPPAGVNLPLWSSSFTFGGNVFPFTMVGTNPTQAGAGTSGVPVVIIPLVLVFNGTFVTPTTSACGDTVSVISRDWSNASVDGVRTVRPRCTTPWASTSTGHPKTMDGSFSCSTPTAAIRAAPSASAI